MKTLHIYPTGVGYHISVAIVLTFLFGLSISNGAYFSTISETPNVSVGKSTLHVLTGINIAVSVASGLLLLWTIYRIITSHESKHKTIHDEYMNLKEHSQSDLGVSHKSFSPHHSQPSQFHPHISYNPHSIRKKTKVIESKASPELPALF